MVKVQNRFAVLEEKGSISKWNILKEAITTMAKRGSSSNKKDDKTELDDMREWQLIYNRESMEYQRKDREIKLKCKKVKEDWLQQRCKEIERTKETEPSSMFKQIKEVIGRRVCSSSRCIKAKDGTVIMDKDKILERWSEYIGELFEDKRQGRPVINCCLDGLKILKSEVRGLKKE